VTIRTKNPLLAVKLGYLDLFRELSALPAAHPKQADFAARGCPAFQIQVSLAFFRDEARAVFEPGAPSAAERIEGLYALAEAGIATVLRIDPLFPRSPLPLTPRKAMKDFGLPEAQTLDDLEHLVDLARSAGASHVVYSPVKIVQPRWRPLSGPMAALLAVYRAVASPDKPVWRGMSWRLPSTVADEHVVGPFLEICQRTRVIPKFCMQDLIDTP